MKSSGCPYCGICFSFHHDWIVLLGIVAWVGSYCSFRAGNTSFQVLIFLKVFVEKVDVLKPSKHSLLCVFSILILIWNGKIPFHYCLSGTLDASCTYMDMSCHRFEEVSAMSFDMFSIV